MLYHGRMFSVTHGHGIANGTAYNVHPSQLDTGWVWCLSFQAADGVGDILAHAVSLMASFWWWNYIAMEI